MGIQEKSLEGIEGIGHPLATQYPNGHDIFQPEDWRAEPRTGTAQFQTYWEWLDYMLQRSDLDPADSRATLFD